MSTTFDWHIGQMIADLYRVREVNTEGGMAIVYFVWHTGWNMEMVLKSPRPELLADQAARARFTQEAETWVHLGLHPNIVTAYYVRQVDGFPRIILEKMDGGSLKTWLARGKVKDLATALDLAIQTASGLAYAQKRPGFVHRDLKPANILLTPLGQAKVTDFGLTGAVSGVVGTPAYMAPEAWTDPEHVTPAADLYSFGVILYELLTGRWPFDRGDAGTSLGQLRGGRGVEGSLGALRDPGAELPPVRTQISLGEKRDIQHLTDRSLGEGTSPGPLHAFSEDDLAFYRQAHTGRLAEPPRRFNASIPPELDALCVQLLAKDPTARPGRAEEVAASLKTIYQDAIGQPYPCEQSAEAELLAGSLNNRAVSYLDLGKNEEAIASWKRALREDPQHLDTTFNLGWVDWKQGRVTDLEFLERLGAIRQAYADAGDYWLAVTSVHRARGDPAALEVLRTDSPPAVREELEAVCKSVEFRQGGEHIFETPDEGSEWGVLCVAFLPDGRHVVCGSDGGWTTTWSLQGGECVACMPGVASALAPSQGGKYLLVGCYDGRIELWSEGVGRIQVLEAADEPILSLAVSADGVFAVSAAGTYPSYVELWNVTRRDPLLRREISGKVISVAFPAAGPRYLSAERDGEVALWAADTGQRLATFAAPGMPAGAQPERARERDVEAAALSPDGRWVLCGSWDSRLCLFEVATQSLRWALAGKHRCFSAVAFCPDGRHAITGGMDKTVRVWDLERGQCLRTFLGHRDEVSCVAVSPDGRFAVSGSADRTIRTWSLNCLSPGASGGRHPFPLLSRPRTLGELGRSSAKVTGLLAKARGLMAAQRPSEAQGLLREAQSVEGYQCREDIMRQITACGMQGGRRRSLRDCWHRHTLEGHRGSVEALALAPDGRCLLTGSADHTVRLWDVETAECLRVMQGHADGVTAVGACPDGRHAVSISDDGTARVWDLETGETLQVYPGQPANPRAIALAAGAREVLYALYGKTFNVAPVDRPGPSRTYAGHTDDVTSLALSPDGRWLLSGSDDRTLRLWARDGADCLRTFEPAPWYVFSVAWSPDGRRAASGCGGDTFSGAKERCVINLWDVASGRCLRACEGHTGSVYSVVFSPDGAFLLSGSGDDILRFWDTCTGRCDRVLEGHRRPVGPVAFTPDGRLAVSGSADGTAGVWEFDYEWEFPEACDWDQEAKPYLEAFLILHAVSPHGDRPGRPTWTEVDLGKLFQTLGCAGYGWLRPEGVHRELEKMATNWQGPPPLPVV